MTDHQNSSAESCDLIAKAQDFVDRKYVARADERQKSMGLAYVEAERQDLAREMARFAEPFIANAGDMLLRMGEAVDAMRAERDQLRAAAQPVAWTNNAQLGFLKNPDYALIPMAMWAERADKYADIPLYAAQPPAATVETSEIETAFLNLCEALGLQATALAYLDAPAAKAALLSRSSAASSDAIDALIAVAHAAHDLADNSETTGLRAADEIVSVETADFHKLSLALELLENLPDDRPGVTMSGPAKAEWALQASNAGNVADLIDRLRNPMWAHSTVPFPSPQLEQEENLAAMNEAAAWIERMNAVPQTAQMLRALQMARDAMKDGHLPGNTETGDLALEAIEQAIEHANLAGGGK